MRLNGTFRKLLSMALIALATVMTGCKAVPEKAPALAPPAVDVDYQAVIPQQAARYQLATGDAVQMPELREKSMPEFPPDMITPQDRSVTVLAQLVINTSGDVERVIFEPSTTADGLEPFRASIRKAVRTWKFSPMSIFHKIGEEKNGQVIQGRTVKPVSLWYQFQFNVKNGQPLTTMKERRAS